MSIDQLIEEIEVYIDNCKTAGMLGGGSMIKVNREDLLAMLEELKNQLPGDLKESQSIIATRDSIIAQAREKSDRIMADAAREAGVMVDDNEIVNLAKMRADEIINNANARANEIVNSAKESAGLLTTSTLEYTQQVLDGLSYMYDEMIEKEQSNFETLISSLSEKRAQIRENKNEIDLQLSMGGKTSRSRADFEGSEA